MKRKPTMKQRGICCPCGRSVILALGLCASCYSMKRQDEEKYGGLREAVLDRDERRCRTCPNLERRKLCVHHRKPGVSKAGADDYPLHALSCHRGADADGTWRNDSTIADSLARETPGWPGATILAAGCRVAARGRAIENSG